MADNPEQRRAALFALAVYLEASTGSIRLHRIDGMLPGCKQPAVEVSTDLKVARQKTAKLSGRDAVQIKASIALQTGIYTP